MSEWQLIETAPRDGTEIELTWMENGRPQEIYPMRWNFFAGNKLVQDHKGIWALHNRDNNAIMATWSEQDPDGAPTHWRPISVLERVRT
jgi:hypothetical protein